MLKWFSISGIFKEMKRIRWSSPKTLAIDTGKVLLFTVLFGIFFVACTLVAAGILKVLGV